MNILTLDIETTGLPPKGAKYETDYMKFPRIVAIGWQVNDAPAQSYIINQEGFDIPPEATAIHDITNEMCNNSLYFLEDALKMLVFLCKGMDLIIGHGIYFDTSIIKANALRLGNEELYNVLTELLHKDKRIDTMVKSTKLCGKWPKLQELHVKLFNEEFNAHDNKSDVEATYKCYNELVKMGVI